MHLSRPLIRAAALSLARRGCPPLVASAAPRRAFAASADRAHAVAEKVLLAHRAALEQQIKQLESNLDPADEAGRRTLAKKRIELGYSDPSNHVAFAEGKADVEKEVFSSMHNQRWRSFLVPRLLKQEIAHGIVGDLLPAAVRPSVNLELNFENTNWLCTYGQPVPPIWTLYSPRLTLTTGDSRTRYFTLALVDVDRPDPDTRSYEEWCHWLVTDVAVTDRLVIPGGSSPLLQRQQQAEDAEAFAKATTGATFVPNAPAQQPEIPGKVLFPYVPAHPPASNPRKLHRYAMLVMEQSGPGAVKVDLEALKKSARELDASVKERNEKEGTPMWKTGVMGEGEEKLMVRGRGLVLPVTKFMQTHNLQLKGHGFFTSTWDIHTPAIFTQLGIHEPVYGSLAGQTARQTVKAITTATSLAATLPGPLATLSAEARNSLNYARPPRPAPARLLTKRGMEVANSRGRDAEALLKRQSKKKSGVDPSLAESSSSRSNSGSIVAADGSFTAKTPRVSVLAAAALVRNKEGDVANGMKGAYVRAEKERRYRYANV
ncbi:hypothetical protein HDU87_004777 [Geranomyces variabilis]|uniref:PEBP-like protein n=1 Tax=Geranomyces variabilis TaxID=109894 RepID=A0AAD5TI50_9FUNG|nr:hypothetical protein HDU87_004777 [Geranomyces variabilis]